MNYLQVPTNKKLQKNPLFVALDKVNMIKQRLQAHTPGALVNVAEQDIRYIAEKEAQEVLLEKRINIVYGIVDSGFMSYYSSFATARFAFDRYVYTRLEQMYRSGFSTFFVIVLLGLTWNEFATGFDSIRFVDDYLKHCKNKFAIRG